MPVECNFEHNGGAHNGGAESRIRRAGGRRLLVATPTGGRVDAVLAERFAARLLGLAFLPASAAPPLLIPRCRSVHTFGMRFALDVCFLALPAGDSLGDATVIEVRPAVRPRRIASLASGAADGGLIATLELRAGAAAGLGIKPGAGVRVELPQARSPRRRDLGALHD